MRISSRRQLAEFKSAVSDSLGFSKKSSLGFYFGARWVSRWVFRGMSLHLDSLETISRLHFATIM